MLLGWGFVFYHYLQWLELLPPQKMLPHTKSMIDNHESLQHIYLSTTSTEFHQCSPPLLDHALWKFLCLKLKHGRERESDCWQMMGDAKVWFCQASSSTSPTRAKMEVTVRWHNQICSESSQCNSLRRKEMFQYMQMLKHFERQPEALASIWSSSHCFPQKDPALSLEFCTPEQSLGVSKVVALCAFSSR